MQRNFPSAFKSTHGPEAVADPKEYARQEQLKTEPSVGPYTGKDSDPREGDSLLENIVEIVDPTGVSSWDDANRAWNKEDKTGWDYVDMAGAIPFAGKVSKVARGLKKGFDLYKASTKAASAGLGLGRLLNAGDAASDIKEDNIK
ncbi:MAG: hypothetical protein ACKVKR_16575 [Pseudomonadales bacterium]